MAFPTVSYTIPILPLQLKSQSFDIFRQSLTFLHQTEGYTDPENNPAWKQAQDAREYLGNAWPPPVAKSTITPMELLVPGRTPKGFVSGRNGIDPVKALENARKAFWRLVEEESNLIMTFGR